MCKQRTAVILITISIVIMMLAMFYLLITSDYGKSQEKSNRLKEALFVPTMKICSEIRRKCVSDNECSNALNYIEKFCLYSDENTFCNQHCQMMITCLSTNDYGKHLFDCNCKRLGITGDRRVTFGHLNDAIIPASGVPWCFPLNSSWCKPDYNKKNINNCAKLASCYPYESLCSANFTISGCQHIALSASMKEECTLLFKDNKCTDLCHLMTKTAWLRTQMNPLQTCICKQFPIPCDFERRIILNHCLLDKKIV